MAAPVLLILLLQGKVELFKWLLALSFFTDAIDGFLARRYKVSSVMGALFDSIADDLTMLAAIIGLVVFKPEFIRQQSVIISILVVLYLTQVALAFLRYRKISSFHTILAKSAAVVQGVFLVAIYFLPAPPLWLFYMAAALTILDLIEEIILVMLLPHWQTDVKGIYWLLRSRPRGRFTA